MLHIALKAFYPATPPFKFLHIDTTWKFKEMIKFRDKVMKQNNLDLIVYTNNEGIKNNVTPFFTSEIYTKIMKTDALKLALNLHKFDASFGGARRDEGKSRSKEEFYLSEINHIIGTLKIKDLSYGIFII